MNADDVSRIVNDALAEPSAMGLLKAAQAISRSVLESGSGAASRDAVIRLCDIREQMAAPSAGISTLVDELCREAGLFNYIRDEDRLAWSDLLVVEACRGGRQINFTLHRDQKIAFEIMKAFGYVVLSAPTSFGKTALIDLLIEELEPTTVVFIVPTIALMDERRRRLNQIFQTRYQIITHKAQQRIARQPCIFVQTQERLLDRDDITQIDLLVLDEFYKLDPRRRDDRFVSLNQALYRFEQIAKKIVLLGPFVKQLDLGRRSKETVRFYESDVSTVAVQVIDKSEVRNKEAELFNLAREYVDEATLVYVQSPASARRVAKGLMDRGFEEPNERLVAFADWLAQAYHPEWSVVSALRRGIALHHGQMPRAVGQVLTRLFNSEDVNLLVCTSTLIEGVNTRAKNVIVYDKKIKTRNLDYFTFKNIMGRSGRMGFHYIGRVVLFDHPPAEEQIAIEIPVYAGGANLDPRFLVQIPDADLDARGRQRKSAILEQSAIPQEIFRRYASFGIEGIETVRRNIARSIEDGKLQFVWSRYPKFPQLVATLELAWPHLHFDKGYLRTARAAAFYASRLSAAEGNYRRFLDDLVGRLPVDEQAEKIDTAFSALRTLEFWVPSVLGLIEQLVTKTFDTKVTGTPNYQSYIAALENLFSSPLARALDEFGLPAPLANKLLQRVRGVDSIDSAIEAVQMLKRASLSDFLTGAERLILDFFE